MNPSKAHNSHCSLETKRPAYIALPGVGPHLPPCSRGGGTARILDGDGKENTASPGRMMRASPWDARVTGVLRIHRYVLHVPAPAPCLPLPSPPLQPADLHMPEYDGSNDGLL